MTKRNSNLDTSHSWSRTETVTHPSTNIAHWHLTSVRREIAIALCHNSRRSDTRRKYVWEKAKGTCVLLANGEQEIPIQSPQVLLISSKSIKAITRIEFVDVYRWFDPNKRKYIWTPKLCLKCRLDYFLATTQMTDLIIDCNIKCGYRSHHSIVKLEICLSNV